MAKPESLFDEFDVVFTYTDAEAVDDGVLVAINPIDRVTRAVWDWLVQHLPPGAKPPDSWPVDLFTWFRSGTNMETKALAAARGAVGTYRTRAEHTWNQNVNGGVFKLWAVTTSSDQVRAIVKAINDSGVGRAE